MCVWRTWCAARRNGLANAPSMLDLGVCRWGHIVLGISARSHAGAAERVAKLSVNAMIGLWARSTEVVYSVRSSSSKLGGAGTDFSQAFAYEGGFEHCMVAKARRILDAPHDIRAVWPCLVKPAQRCIACFETLAQLALLQATHSHIGGGHYSFSMPSGTDNSATEASLNKLFTTSWPLQLFVQLTAFWAHAHNVLLQPTHVPGRCNDWADDLSRGRLARFSHRPESRIRFSPASLAMSGRGIQLCMRPGVLNIWQQLPSSLNQPSLHPTWPSEPFSVNALSARITGNVSQPLTQAALTRKKCSRRMPSCSQHSVPGDPSICPARYNPTLKGG